MSLAFNAPPMRQSALALTSNAGKIITTTSSVVVFDTIEYNPLNLTVDLTQVGPLFTFPEWVDLTIIQFRTDSLTGTPQKDLSVTHAAAAGSFEMTKSFFANSSTNDPFTSMFVIPQFIQGAAGNTTWFVENNTITSGETSIDIVFFGSGV